MTLWTRSRKLDRSPSLSRGINIVLFQNLRLSRRVVSHWLDDGKCSLSRLSVRSRLSLAARFAYRCCCLQHLAADSATRSLSAKSPRGSRYAMRSVGQHILSPATELAEPRCASVVFGRDGSDYGLDLLQDFWMFLREILDHPVVTKELRHIPAGQHEQEVIRPIR